MNPFKPLISYSEDEQREFFGRTVETENILDKIEQSNYILLYGKSGVGKTSLLNAGLIPAARKEGYIPIVVPTQSLINDSGSPYESLFVYLESVAIKERVDLRPKKELKPTSLWEFFHCYGFYKAGDELKPLLILDQFEEVFYRGSGSERTDAFLDELSFLIEDYAPTHVSLSSDYPEYLKTNSKVKVILSFREEFLADVEAIKKRIPSVSKHGYYMRLYPFNYWQAEDVIRRLGSQFFTDNGISTFLSRISPKSIEDKGAQLIEPYVLSLYAYLLIESLKVDQQIDLSVRSDLFEKMLEKFYNVTIDKLDKSTKIFVEDKLLNKNGTRAHVSTEAALSEIGQSELKSLINSKLIKRVYYGGQEIEIVHDQLTSVIRTERDKRIAGSRARRKWVSIIIALVFGALFISTLWYLKSNTKLTTLVNDLQAATDTIKNNADSIRSINDSLRTLNEVLAYEKNTVTQKGKEITRLLEIKIYENEKMEQENFDKRRAKNLLSRGDSILNSILKSGNRDSIKLMRYNLAKEKYKQSIAINPSLEGFIRLFQASLVIDFDSASRVLVQAKTKLTDSEYKNLFITVCFPIVYDSIQKIEQTNMLSKSFKGILRAYAPHADSSLNKLLASQIDNIGVIIYNKKNDDGLRDKLRIAKDILTFSDTTFNGPISLHFLGKINEEEGNDSLALIYYIKHADKVKDKHAFSHLSDIYYRQRKYGLAIDPIRKQVVLENDDEEKAGLYLLLANCYYHTNNIALAKMTAEKAILHSRGLKENKEQLIKEAGEIIQKLTNKPK